jgi:hypothetical protein
MLIIRTRECTVIRLHARNRSAPRGKSTALAGAASDRKRGIATPRIANAFEVSDEDPSRSVSLGLISGK